MPEHPECKTQANGNKRVCINFSAGWLRLRPSSALAERDHN